MSKKLSNKLSNKFLGTSILEVPGSKNNRGISLMSMIITIIVIIIKHITHKLNSFVNFMLVK